MSDKVKNIIFNTDDADVITATSKTINYWFNCQNGGDGFENSLNSAIDAARTEIDEGGKKVAYVVIKITDDA